MKMTKIKRRNLNRGDLYALELDSIQGVPRVYVALVDGVTIPINVANETIYRIDVPDNTSDSTSEYIKTLEAKIIRQSRYITKQFDNIDDRDKHIEELEKENRDLKTIAANSESYTHRMDELLRSCKSDVEQRDVRIKELIAKIQYDEYCIDKLLIDQATLQDTVHQLQMKIFDIEGQEDLVTTELEHQIKELQDIIQKKIIDKRKMLSELKECHLLDIGDWQTRVDKLLAETKGRERVNVRLMHKVEGLEDENRGLIKAIAKNDGTSLVNLELLSIVLEIVDPLTKSTHTVPYLAGHMQKLCDDVVAFRKIHDGAGIRCRHNIEQLESANCALRSRVDELEAEREQSEQYVARAEAYESRLRSYIASYESKIESDKIHLELLDSILKHANPMIRTGMWRTTVGSCEFMRDVCQDVIDFRRKHNIVG